MSGDVNNEVNGSGVNVCRGWRQECRWIEDCDSSTSRNSRRNSGYTYSSTTSNCSSSKKVNKSPIWDSIGRHCVEQSKNELEKSCFEAFQMPKKIPVQR
ncbi:hypothetical protein QJS10_CPA01g02441 [Acorus calamus]|uniref:Uncharacterized protein n=1 Tax=Acorus calamus TaxID=4465 RepID=A0AAV9FF70_ACOCL|nr:hypothetical protein QJS10_CPA01g02441 [Acorus calamus]